MSTHSSPHLNVPAGSVYFSQMHSLNWWDDPNDQAILDSLYHEILVYGLQNESLIVTDSHALQSAWLRDLLINSEKYPGMPDLISEGVIRIAKRTDGKTGSIVPLTDTVGTQINSVNVVLGGKEALMPEDFGQHARKLEDLTLEAEKRGHPVPAYSLERIDLAGLMRMTFTHPEFYTSYGLSPAVADYLLENFHHFISSDRNLFMARSLYQFADTRAGQHLKPVQQQLKILAASVHSCNFALHHHLPPSTSPLAVDHRGAMSLFQKRLPEFNYLPEYQVKEPHARKAISGKQPAAGPGFNTSMLTPRIILGLRQSDQFKAYVQARHNLFMSFQVRDSLTIKRNTELFTAANLDYVTFLLKQLDFSLMGDSTARLHMTRIEQAAKRQSRGDSFLVSLWNHLLPGKMVHILAIDDEAQQAAVENASEVSRDVLMSTKRILNIL